MAKDKKRTFLFNIDWRDVLMDYPAEVRHEVYDAIIEYAASGKLSEMKPLAKMAFSFIKKEMDYNQSLYEAKVETNRENGRKGGAPAGNSNARASQGEAAQGNPEQPKTTETTQNNRNNPNQPKTTETTQNNPNQPKTTETTLYDNHNDNDNHNELTNVSIGRGEAARAATLARREKFRQELEPYAAQYGEAMLADFFSYWAETNRSGTKMRYEQQPTWETARRLATWARKDKDYGNSKQRNTASGAADAEARREKAARLTLRMLAEGGCAH